LRTSIEEAFMSEHNDLLAVDLPGAAEQFPTSEPTADVVETPEPMEAVTPTAPANGESAQPRGNDWHAEAGRKGAFRIRELIRYGKLYEQEHGLKSGRQRLRQLIEEGKLYEQEHGLRPAPRNGRRSRGPRMSKQELVSNLLHSLVRLARPGLRGELMRLIEDLDRPPVQP
jgi:hypothetical protein